MLRKFSWVFALALLVPAAAQAQFHQGDWELTIAAQAANSVDFDGVTAGATGSLGYFLTKELELGIRQSLSYTDINVAGSAWQGQTNAFADWHFDLGAWQPFIGANLGYLYGQNVKDTWTAAPEGGVKYFINSTTFVELLVQYQFFFNDQGDNFSDGQFVYTLGLGFRW